MFKKHHYFLLALLLTGLAFVSCNKDEDENTLEAPVVQESLHVYGDYFYVNWIGVTAASGYVADVATDQNFANIIPAYNDKDVGVNGIFIVEGLDPNTSYYVRMRSYNAEGSSPNSSFKEYKTRAANDLPNMDMEEWITYPDYESVYPEGVWTSANKVVDLNPNYYPALLYKTDDAQSGNYAAKMVTKKVDLLPLLTGSLSTGVFNVNLENYLESMISGVPYKSRPTRFQGYYKYFGVDGDSCEIRTTLSRWNAAEHKKDIIGEAIMRDTNLVENYKYFDMEIVYFMSGNPDTIDMVFAASAGGEYFIGGVESTLFIDNVSLKFD